MKDKSVVKHCYHWQTTHWLIYQNGSYYIHNPLSTVSQLSQKLMKSVQRASYDQSMVGRICGTGEF